MERRLLNFIMTPAMAVTWILGIVLVLQGQWFAATWFHVKFALVLVMTVLARSVSASGLMISPSTATRHSPEILSYRQ